MAKQKLKGLEMYQYIEKISDYRYNKDRHTKARSIVAMLFWEWRGYKREREYEMECTARTCFQQAYKMLKDNK